MVRDSLSKQLIESEEHQNQGLSFENWFSLKTSSFHSHVEFEPQDSDMAYISLHLLQKSLIHTYISSVLSVLRPRKMSKHFKNVQ